MFRKSLRWVIFVFISVVTISCQKQQEEVLRIGANGWSGYSPLFLARELELYHESPIHIVELPSASEVMHALRSGNLEGAALTLDEVLLLLEEGMDLKVILIVDISRGADVLLAKPDIKSMSELKGKNIAVEYTAVGALLLDLALDSAHLSVNDIRIVGCTFDEHQKCYQQADAIVTFEPAKSQLLKMGAIPLFDSSAIHDEIMDVLVVQNKFVNSHRESIKRLIKGYFDARRYMSKQPQESNAIVGQLIGINELEVKASLQGLYFPDKEAIKAILDGSPSVLQNQASKLNNFMVKRKLMSRVVNVKQISDAQFIE